MSQKSLKSWWKSGSPWIWLSAGAVSTSLLMVFGLLILIAINGLSYFWPNDVYEIKYKDKDGSLQHIAGEVWATEEVPAIQLQDSGYEVPEDAVHMERFLVKVGNRELTGSDFRQVVKDNISEQSTPENILAIERFEWGNFYGFLRAIKEDGRIVAEGNKAYEAMHKRLERISGLHKKITNIEKVDIGHINYEIERLRLNKRKLELKNKLTPEALEELNQKETRFNEQYQEIKTTLDRLYTEASRDVMVLETIAGQEVELPMAKVVHVYQPNQLGLFGKIGHYFAKLWEFVSAPPREANTEGGVLPAIFGTVMMVMIMSVLVTPFGVMAAVYLREYAKQGFITRTIRIAVNNLAGVPSIVYGVFGLGFFVYFIGGSIDQLLYPEALPAPTFGTPGILWASLTLAILTLPVVIVATEEGLSRIPSSIRQGSLALGATHFETLWRTVIPMSSPAIMTGLILAVARAAGEVAPLMLVGVVKLAPAMPLDGNFPFLHLDRKFMHLGFHIYDVGFQSPNVEAARPLVYATAFLLVMVIMALNLAAISIRNRLRERYRQLES